MEVDSEVNDFIVNFHNLAGKSINAKKKSLFLLLRNIPQDSDTLMAALVPKNQLETQFRLSILLKLQRIPDLIKVLKTGDELLAAKLLKNKPFCQKLAAILDESTLDFANSVMPCLSYVIRLRLLTKLAIYGTKLDLLFEEIATRYGIHIAASLLLGCTTEKIENILTNHNLTLSPRLLKVLYVKHPRLFLVYLQRSCVDESVFSYIADKDMELLMKITQDRTCLPTNLGKRATRKLLKNFKDTVITNAGKFFTYVHLKTVIRVLGKDFEQFYLNSFPPNFDSFEYSPVKNHVAVEKLGKQFYVLLANGLKKIYSKNIDDYPHFVSHKMMEDMDVEERERWVKIKQKEHPDQFVEFMKISEAVPLIKSKINVTSSVRSRENLLGVLLDTCKVNKDLDALAEALQYVCSRHRNDEALADFLDKLKCKFQLQKLEPRHWDLVHKIINILNARGEALHVKRQLSMTHLEFLFDRNQLQDQDISEHVKLTKCGRWRYENTQVENLMRRLILKWIDLMPDLEDKDLELHDLILINRIITFNATVADKISFLDYPRLVESLRKSIRLAIIDDHYDDVLLKIKSVLEYIICCKEQSQFRNELIDSYFQVGFRYYHLKIDLYLLKTEPETVAANFSKFLEHVTSSYHPDLQILNYIKNYSFAEKTIRHCCDKIKNHEQQNKAFLILARLMPAEDFLQFIAPFQPTTDRFEDDSTDDCRRTRDTITAIAASFKYTTDTRILPALINYCRGDFLRYSLESLYYLFYHFPENQLSIFIKTLSTKAVSVRKHSIFLTCIVGTAEDVAKLLTCFLENERNVSMQKHLFTAALKYFVRNPSDKFWECVKTCMSKVDKNDSESFGMLVNVRQIPTTYKARHVIFVWEILKKIEHSDKHRSRLLSSIPAEVFEDLPLAFLLEVISGSFLSSSNINDFVISALTKSAHADDVLLAVFGILTQRVLPHDSLAEEKEAREAISDFLNCFVDRTTADEQNQEIMRKFSERWRSVFTPVQAFEEHLKLSISLLYVNDNKDLVKLASSVGEFLGELVASYGMAIVDLFASVLNDCLRSFLGCYSQFSEDYFLFCLNLIRNRDGLVFYLVVIKLLPNKEPTEDNARGLFREVIQRLRTVPQDAVQILLNFYVKNME